MPPERISKVLAAAGVASRRGADELDRRRAGDRGRAPGRARGAGGPARRSGSRSPDGRCGCRRRARSTSRSTSRWASRRRCATDTPSATVIDLIPTELSRGARLYPVGRLDQDSEGLILVTNDGDWAEHVLHPRYGVEREYAVGLAQQLTRDQAQALETGVELSEGMATLSGLRGQTNTEDRRLADMLDPPPDHRLVWVRVTIHQGWKRQLRRMFAEVGAPVRRLVRVRIGALRLEGLAAGDVRPLTPAEVRRLASAAVPPQVK